MSPRVILGSVIGERQGRASGGREGADELGWKGLHVVSKLCHEVLNEIDLCPRATEQVRRLLEPPCGRGRDVGFCHGRWADGVFHYVQNASRGHQAEAKILVVLDPLA